MTAIHARNVSLASLLISPHHCAYKLVEMEEDLHYHAMMETTIRETVVLLTVGCKLVGAVQEDLRIQEIRALRQSLRYSPLS